MLLSLVLALSSLLTLQSLAAEEGTPSFKITPLTSTVIGLKDDFVFTCLIDNYNYTVSLLIDNTTNSTKLDRIRSQIPKYSLMATMLIYTLLQSEGVTKNNISISIPYPPNRTFSIFDSFYTAQYTDLTAGQYYTLHVYAANMLGSTYARNYTFTIPASKPTTKKKSHAGAVAAGVIIPLLVISLIAIAVAGYYYYYKKKQHRNGFSLIPGGDEGAINSGYRTDKIVT